MGGGPASLTVARDLAPIGYECVVFDQDPLSGGMMRTQIPKFRLPEKVIDEECGYILDLGVEFVGGRRIDSMKALLAEDFDAVFVGCGAPRGRDLDIPGRKEAAKNIHIGIDWLSSVSFGHLNAIGKRVIVLGGVHGKVEMDLYTQFQKNNLTMVGCGSAHHCDYPYDEDGNIAALMNMMQAGMVKPAPAISHCVDYRQGPEIFRMLIEEKDKAIGVQFDWRKV